MRITIPDYLAIPMRDMVGSVVDEAGDRLDTLSAKRSLTVEEKTAQAADLIMRVTVSESLYKGLCQAVEAARSQAEAGEQAPEEPAPEGDDETVRSRERPEAA